MAISDKLQELIDIKQDIKVAIENKDVDLTGVAFTEYANKIADISGGSSEATMIELTSGNNCVEKVQSLNLIGTYFLSGQVYPMPLTAQLNKTNIEHNHDLIQALFSQDITSIKSELMSYIQTNTADIGIPLPSGLEGMILSYVGFVGDPNLQPSGVRHIDFRIVMSKENEVDKKLEIDILKPMEEYLDGGEDLMKNIVIDLGEAEVVFYYTDISMTTALYLNGTNTIGTYSDYLSLLNNGWTAKLDISTSY